MTVGWDQAETGMGGDSGELFAATKGAIMSFTRSLAVSLAPGGSGSTQHGPRLESRQPGAKALRGYGKTECSRKPPWPAGAQPKMSRRSPASWSARPPDSSPAKLSASTADPCAERGHE